MGETSSFRKSNNVVVRSFGSGARPILNDWDKFLETLGFYRKLTAFNSTSLFRVVSELCYDIQLHHEKVRRECVDFMRENKPLFEEDIEMDFDAYMNSMSKNKTPGTTLELKALALHHKANVFLFQPLTKGKWIVNNPLHKDTWRVFVSHGYNFHAVFTLEYMKIAAECQAIAYEILFKGVFGMPDIEYAVERMLHDPDDTTTIYEQDADGRTVATTADGRQLVLSTAENTKCVLSHEHLCHFHNRKTFPSIQRYFSKFGNDAGCLKYIGSHFRAGVKKSSPLLPDANVSCMRQLLEIGISPFPYKTAKCLDNNIYRNIEFGIGMIAIYDDIDDTDKSDILTLAIDVPRPIGVFRNEETKYIRPRENVKPSGNDKRASRNYERARLPVSGDMEQPVDDATITTLDSAENVGQFGRVDQALNMLAYPGVVPYPLQQIYFPPSDPYAINPVGIIPADANNAHNTVGVPAGGFYSPYVAPMQFHVPAQPQHQPQPQLQPVQLPALPTHEQSVEVDEQHLGFVPHSSNHAMQNVAGEYVMLVDSMQQQLQQQQMIQYAQYAGHPWIHGCFYCYVPNGAEPNDGTTMIPYDMNSYSSPSVQGPQFWAA